MGKKEFNLHENVIPAKTTLGKTFAEKNAV